MLPENLKLNIKLGTCATGESEAKYKDFENFPRGLGFQIL